MRKAKKNKVIEAQSSKPPSPIRAINTLIGEEEQKTEEKKRTEIKKIKKCNALKYEMATLTLSRHRRRPLFFLEKLREEPPLISAVYKHMTLTVIVGGRMSSKCGIYEKRKGDE